MADKSQGRSVRNASSSLGGLAERTLVDAGAARQATLVGIPGPARRAAGVSKGQTPLILHEPTIVDPPRSRSLERAPSNDDAASRISGLDCSIPLGLVTKKPTAQSERILPQDALEEPPEASVAEDDDEDDEARYIVRGGRVVGATAARRSTGVWLLLLAIAAGYGGYRYRAPLKEQGARLVTLARAATATPSPRHEPVIAAPPVVPAASVASAPATTPPPAPNAHVPSASAAPVASSAAPIAKKASPTVAHPPTKIGKKSAPPRSASTSDNPY